MNRRIARLLACVGVGIPFAALSPAVPAIEIVNPYPAVGPHEISGITPANKVLRAMQDHAVPPVTDTIVRDLQRVLSRASDMPVSVVRRPRAGGSDALRHVVEAARDGRTLLLGGSDTIIVSSLVRPDTRYDPMQHLTPVALVARMPVALVSVANVSSVRHLLEQSRDAATPLHLGSSGDLSTSHLAGALFKRATQTVHEQVAFNGAHPAIRAVIAEHVHATFVPLPSVLHYAHNARFRILAISDSARHAVLPDVPTLMEAGVSDVIVSGWYGLFAAAATPAHAVERLNGLLAQEGWSVKEDSLLRHGLQAVHLSRVHFTEIIRTDHERWKAHLNGGAIR